MAFVNKSADIEDKLATKKKKDILFFFFIIGNIAADIGLIS